MTFVPFTAGQTTRFLGVPFLYELDFPDGERNLYWSIDGLLTLGQVSTQPGPPQPPVQTSIALSNQTVQEQVLGAVVGAIMVTPSGAYVFTVTDPAGDLWEVAAGTLKLKADKQVLFADGATHTVTISATLGALTVVGVFPIAVQQIIIPPPPNRAPNDIQLDNLTVPDHTLGAVVGTLTALDPDLPLDTETFDVFDARFVAVPINNYQATLQLAPTVQLDASVTPTISLNVQVTDTGELFVTKNFTITVTATSPPAGGGFSLGFSLGFNS